MSKKNMITNPGAHISTVDAQMLNIDTSITHASLSSFAIAVRVLAKNWQQGTVACKGRSEVAKTNRKPWKQKGTGRARAGDAKSPLWRGGGVIFGPQERVRTLKMSKKLKCKVMLELLSGFIKQNNVLYSNWTLQGEVPKTAAAQEFLNKSGLADKKIALFIAPNDMLTASSFINIPNVRPLFFDQPNVYQLANSDCWLFFEKDLDHFKGMVSQWT